MNQSDIMKQLVNMEQLTNIASGMDTLDLESMSIIKEAMSADQMKGVGNKNGERMASPFGPSGGAATVNSHWGKEYETSAEIKKTKFGKPLEKGVDSKYIEIIISIRDKLDDFLDGSNILLKVMNPQTIREMVREMRYEIRQIKLEQGISELMVIDYLERKMKNEEDDLPF